jgi:hypothetical protein
MMQRRLQECPRGIRDPKNVSDNDETRNVREGVGDGDVTEKV